MVGLKRGGAIGSLKTSKADSDATIRETYRPERMDFEMCLAVACSCGAGQVPELCFMSVDFKDAFKHINIDLVAGQMSAAALVKTGPEALPSGATASTGSWGRLPKFVSRLLG